MGSRMNNAKRKFLKIVLMSLILACVVTILWIIVVSGMIPQQIIFHIQQIIFRISIILRQIILSISYIPYELIIMVGGYVLCAQLAILIFVHLYRKNPEYGKGIIILSVFLAIVSYSIGGFAGLSFRSSSLWGFMGWRFTINEFVIIFWNLGNLCILATLVALAVMLFYKIKQFKLGEKSKNPCKNE